MTDHQDVSLDWMSGEDEEPHVPVDLRPDVPHPARMYDYYLGGKDNFPADREAAEQVVSLGPLVRISARANRAFLQRAVRHLAEQGITQFLDIGTGIPTAGNTHEVAQEILPQARVAYVDNDPIVLVHGRALLAGSAGGSVSVVQGDLRDPKAILADPAVRAVIDFDRPVGLLLFAVLHFIDDADDPYGIVRTLLDALPAGSHLALSHATGDFTTPEQAAKGPAVYRAATAQLSMRSREQVARFFEGLELAEPGLVTAPQWRPDQEPEPTDHEVAIWAAVGRKA
ncbi:SAM-dependent methyltransferase [Kitasatospora sp. NPDC048540]|uniref:SAM-dependent methyltransferase n=1 Tax=unclassified Kitasatospora TaxID=2633591 RepID=UPI0009E6A13A|nr:SAM-dependent methyltransferase [Kitasatospora sp. MBT63]